MQTPQSVLLSYARDEIPTTLQESGIISIFIPFLIPPVITDCSFISWPEQKEEISFEAAHDSDGTAVFRGNYQRIGFYAATFGITPRPHHSHRFLVEVTSVFRVLWKLRMERGSASEDQDLVC